MTTQESFPEKIKQKAVVFIESAKYLLADEVSDSRMEREGWITVHDVLGCYAEEEKKHQNELRIMQASIDSWKQLAGDRATKLEEHKQKLQPIFEHYRERFVNHIWMCYDNGSIFNEFLTDWMNQILDFEEILKAYV